MSHMCFSFCYSYLLYGRSVYACGEVAGEAIRPGEGRDAGETRGARPLFACMQERYISHRLNSRFGPNPFVWAA